MRVGARVFDLRRRGIDIASWNEEHSSSIWFYQLRSPLEQIDFESCKLKVPASHIGESFDEQRVQHLGTAHPLMRAGKDSNCEPAKERDESPDNSLRPIKAFTEDGSKISPQAKIEIANPHDQFPPKSSAPPLLQMEMIL